LGVKELLNSSKYNKDSITARIDNYLATNEEDNDRAVDVNSPSQVFKCMRSLYYARIGAESDGFTDPRLQRIFDNGTHMHLRIQEYLTKEGSLVMDECPCIDAEANIQGHTDGILKMTEQEYAILELKSMNSILFGKLKEPKPEHIAQAMIYMYCTECRRQELVSMTEDEFKFSLDDRVEFYRSRYQHLKAGKKHTREEKIQHNIITNLKLDNLLHTIKRPIDRIVFLYENKDNQELKEFVIEYDDDLMCDILDFYDQVNYYVANKKVPPREGTSKSCNICRFCSYRNECYVV
jgi:hypothetical protein